MKTVIGFVVCLMGIGCVRVPSDSPVLDARYKIALQHILADSVRYRKDLSGVPRSAGLRIADSLYCMALDLFFKKVFQMKYGEYAAGNPHVSTFHSQEGNRYRSCRGMPLPELSKLSNKGGPEAVIFFSKIMDEVLPGRDGLKGILVPDYPGEPNYVEFTHSYLTSYEYMFLFDPSGRIDTVLAGRIFR